MRKLGLGLAGAAVLIAGCGGGGTDREGDAVDLRQRPQREHDRVRQAACLPQAVWLTLLAEPPSVSVTLRSSPPPPPQPARTTSAAGSRGIDEPTHGGRAYRVAHRCRSPSPPGAVRGLRPLPVAQGQRRAHRPLRPRAVRALRRRAAVRARRRRACRPTSARATSRSCASRAPSRHFLERALRVRRAAGGAARPAGAALRARALPRPVERDADRRARRPATRRSTRSTACRRSSCRSSIPRSRRATLEHIAELEQRCLDARRRHRRASPTIAAALRARGVPTSACT